MKKILDMIIAALVLAACGNGNIDPDTPPATNPPAENPGDKPEEKPVEKIADKIIGSWHSTSIAIDGDIYLSFTSDGKMELYQKIGEGAYRLYRGTWTINETNAVLSGKYNDGTDWASSYKIVIADRNMTLTSDNEAKEESKFTKADIPSEIKEGSIVAVKSGKEAPVL